MVHEYEHEDSTVTCVVLDRHGMLQDLYKISENTIASMKGKQKIPLQSQVENNSIHSS
jgi:hypothetical protein